MPSELSRAVRLCGTQEIEAPVRSLRAGPLSADLDAGALRAIRLGEVEDVVHADDAVIELREHFVGKVERTILGDIDLAAGEDLEVAVERFV